MTSRRIVAASLALVALVACSGGEDGQSEPGTTAAPTAATAVDHAATPTTGTAAEPTTSAAPPSTTAPSSSSNPAPATDVTTTTIGTVPDTGVPGIDSADAFCRAWSEFAGSFQALAGATTFGSDPAAPARLEVAAAPVLVAAVEALDANLPAELEAERTAFVEGLVGPLARRAGQARDALVDAGLTADEIDQLGATWLATLAESGLDDPELDVVVPAGIDADAFGTAVGAFRSALPPINQDPSLITDAQTPQTERYLALNCPDQGTLGGNDVVDQF